MPAALPAAADAAPLARGADRTLADQLAGRFAERIRQRLLAPGARLPSVRDCAARHAVSATTVVAAYDQLLAQGLVEARPQRGFFVRGSGTMARGGTARGGVHPGREGTGHPGRDAGAGAGDARGRAGTPSDAGAADDAGTRGGRDGGNGDDSRNAPSPPLPVSATALIRAMFQPAGSVPNPALGTLPAEWLDLPLVTAAMRRATSGAALAGASLRYGDPTGEPALRAALARRLADLGIAAEPGQIVTTIGATHALDLVTRTLTRPGDSVLVDEPGWAVEYARLAALGLTVLPVPRGDDGPDLATMQALIDAQPAHAKPRLYVTVPVLANPTGASLGLQAAHRVLRLAQGNALMVVEDDTYAWLAGAHLPRLAALDGLERTVHIGGFSKILAPAWRVGFAALPTALVDRVVDTKLLSTLSTPSVTELALAHCLDSGALRRHAERVRQRLDGARARVVRLAEAHGVRFAAPPRGLFGWVDVGVDTERLAERLLDAGWLTAPGALFHAAHRPTTLMRINFATSQEPRFWRALAAARDAQRHAV